MSLASPVHPGLTAAVPGIRGQSLGINRFPLSGHVEFPGREIHFVPQFPEGQLQRLIDAFPEHVPFVAKPTSLRLALFTEDDVQGVLFARKVSRPQALEDIAKSLPRGAVIGADRPTLVGLQSLSRGRDQAFYAILEWESLNTTRASLGLAGLDLGLLIGSNQEITSVDGSQVLIGVPGPHVPFILLG